MTDCGASADRTALSSVLQCSAGGHCIQDPHRLASCLHSFCQKCLKHMPLKHNDCVCGRFCPECNTFSSETDIKPSAFIQELIDLDNCLDNVICKPVCGQCTNYITKNPWRCDDCKISLCCPCHKLHTNIPMLKNHRVCQVGKDMPEKDPKILDSLVFCKHHADMPLQMYCKDCSELICYRCKSKDHDCHSSDCADNALRSMLPIFESHTEQNREKCGNIHNQICAVKSKIEETKQSFASQRKQLGEQLENVICRLRGVKGNLQDDLAQQETLALASLNEVQTNLERHLSKTENMNNLSDVCLTKTRQISQLSVMNDRLYSHVIESGSRTLSDVACTIPDVTFMPGNFGQKKMKKFIGNFKIEKKEESFCRYGIPVTSPLEHLSCHDFSKIKGLCLENEYVLPTTWSNRISLIDDVVWVPFHRRTRGICKVGIIGHRLEEYKQVDYNLAIVRNIKGHMICAGNEGLYITNKHLCEFTLLAEGEFSDLIVSDDHFYAFRHCEPSIYRFCLVRESCREVWKQCERVCLEEACKECYNFDCNSTVYMNTCKEFMITSSDNECIYFFNYKGHYVRKYSYPCVDPAFCGQDKTGKVLVADYNHGDLYTFNISDQNICLTKMKLDSTITKVLDVVINCCDGQQYLWALCNFMIQDKVPDCRERDHIDNQRGLKVIKYRIKP